MDYPHYQPDIADAPLRDEELSTLDAMLQALPNEAAMNVEALDGYLTALLVGPPVGLGGDVGIAAPGKTHLAAGTGQALPDGRVGIVGRVHRHAVGGQCGNDGAVLVGHRLDAGHEFLVLTLRVVDQGHGGLGDVGQLGDFARVVHAQFQHRDTVAGAQTQ